MNQMSNFFILYSFISLTVTPKTSKPSTSGQEALPAGSSPISDKSLRDSEIIKLLNQKSADVTKDVQPLPAGKCYFFNPSNASWCGLFNDW